MAQKEEPRRGDWYSETQTILKEFEISVTENEIVNMSQAVFKNIVKKKSLLAAIKYLKIKQKKCEKGLGIEYNSLEIQNYLNPCSNISLEDQRFIFSLRCEMNPIKNNFKRNMIMNTEYCIKSCQKELDNQHITWCDKMNEEKDFRFEHLLNGTLQEKVQTLKQIKLNEKNRNIERIPCDPVNL